MAISLSELRNSKKQNSISIKNLKNYIENNPLSDSEKQNIYNSMLISKRKSLENQLSNYDRKEKVEWWSDDNNFFENVGNVLYKTFIERQPTKYEEDETYNKLKSEYDEINKAIEDYRLANTEYEEGILGGFQKVGDTIAGNAMSSIKGIESSINKLTGLPTNSKITYEERLAQKARQETTGIGGVGLDLVGSFTRMLPQMLAPNPITATAIGFANYGGSAYNEAKREGADETRATIYGLTVGGLEMAMSKILGGFENVYGKSVLGKLNNKILSNVIKSPTLRRTVSGATGEFTEEYLQQFLEPIVKNTILQEENGADFWNTMKDDIGEGLKQLSKQFFNMENLYAGLLGGLSSSALQLPSNIAQSKINSQNQVNLQNIGTIQDITNNENNMSNNSQNTPKTVYDLVQQEQNSQNNVNLPVVDNNGNIVNSNKFEYIKSDNIDNNIFSQQIDEVLNGTYPKRDMLVVSEQTPPILQEIGLKNLPITMTQKHLYTMSHSDGKYENANYHDIDIDVIKQLPQALANPLNVLKSDTKSDSIVVVTELADKNDNIIVASIKIDGKGTIQDVRLDTNVMTSAYGKSGNYDYFMKDNISKGNLLYDIDDGIIQKINNDTQKKSDVKDRVQFPMRDSSSSTSASDIPKNISPISYNDNSTNLDNSQIMQSSINSSMQNQSNNTQKMPTQEDIRKMELKDTKLPTRKTLNNTKNNHISNESKEIAQKLNETIQSDVISTKQRSWVETSTESDVLKNKVLIKDLDTSKINYVPISNKTTLEKANSKLDNLGYDKAVEYIQSKLNDSSISLEDIALAERLIQESAKHGDTMLAADLIMDTAILGTELGRKTQILSMIQRLTPEGQLKHFQKIVKRAKAKGEKSFQNVEITLEMVDLILKAYNQDGTYDQADLNSRVEQFKQKVADQLTTSKAEKINAWRYLSMLGNPKTHIRNLVSNVAMMGTTKVKNAMARTMEMALPAESRTKTWKKPTQVVSDFVKQTTVEMKDIITGEGKYSEKGSIESKKQIFKSKTLEKLSDFNSNALSAEDWFFSKRAFESSLREYLTAQGIKTQTDIENNSQIVEKAKMYALEQSEIATFRQYSWLANQIGKIERKNAGTKLLVGSMLPFKKTPINVAKAGVKYSPIGLIKSISYDAFQLKRGNIEASQFIDNLAQGMTGTSLALLGYALAKAGILNGAGDDDKEGKYDYYLGKQSYSLKVGGKTFSISWLSPVAMPLLVGANAYEKLEEGEDWDMNVIVDTLAQTLDPLSEMSFVSSLTDVLQSYQMGSAQMISEMGQNITQNYISQFFPTLFSQLASTLDDTKRSTSASKNSPWKFGEETIRKIMYKIPGLRNQLEAGTDIWGNEIKQNENIVMRAVENFLAPYTAKNDTTDYLDRELKNIYNKTGETGVIPGIPQGYLKYKDETYYMSAEEYTKYKKTYGTTANQYLRQLIGNSNYKNASDEEKATMIEQMYKYSSAKANEEYFESQNIEYSSDVLKDLEAFEELNMNNTQIAEYVSLNKLSSSIKNDDDIDSINKKSEISKLMANSNLNDEQLAYLYEKYYSSEEALKNVMDAKIPVKDFIRFNSQEFTTDYYSNGTAVPNSRKNKVINYVNSLNLSIPQKAMLIKMEYSSYDRYDSQIINYINNMNYTKFEKASILKQFGINSYDTYIINHIKLLNITLQEKTEMLEDLGFTVRNGRVYS